MICSDHHQFLLFNTLTETLDSWEIHLVSSVLLGAVFLPETAPDASHGAVPKGNYPNLFRAGPLTRYAARCIVRGSRDERDCSLKTE